jgi:hypothetical protein
MDENSPKGFAYFDSNVISHIVRGELENPIQILEANGIKPIVSEVVLHELQSGSPCGEQEFIEERGFWYTSAHEAIFLDGRASFYTRPIDVGDASSSEPVEDFLRKFVRSLSGSGTAGDLTELLVSNTEALMDSLQDELSPTSDPRILAAWVSGRSRLSFELANLPAVRRPLFGAHDARKMNQLGKEIGGIKPPGIVDQIMANPLLEGGAFLAEMRKPFASEENIKERTQTLCLALVALGFSRDRRLPNDNEQKSEAGARTQFNDAYHISAALTCGSFVTADKRCAKLAFAVYEALGFRKEVYLAVPNAAERQFGLLGSNFWP